MSPTQLCIYYRTKCYKVRSGKTVIRLSTRKFITGKKMKYKWHMLRVTSTHVFNIILSVIKFFTFIMILVYYNLNA